MTKKITLLIFASIFGLLALSLVQGYLIKKTYELNKESFVNKVNQEVSRIDDYTPAIDAINETWQSLFIEELDDYHLKEISKEALLKRLRSVTDSLNPLFVKEYKKELATKRLDFDLQFHKIVTNIRLVDSVKTDTIFKGGEKPFFKLLGSDFKSNKDLQISNSVWNTERSFTRDLNGERKRGEYQLYFETRDYINIEKWNSIILNQMKGLLLLSFLVFLFVIGIMYYSIKSLIRQKKAADVKTDFINNITHELKTPLATLTLATKILKKDEVINQPKLVNDTVETIERQNVRLQKLIDQVLDNSLGYATITLKKESIEVDTYLNSVLDDFLLSVKESDIDLERNLSITSQHFFIDTFYITTALLNILENAVKYGGTKIKVFAKLESPEAITIEIKDNGIGISKKNQQQLFDKFFRIENTEIHNVKGLGLGLYYCKQVLKAHKGNIHVISKEEQGATFVIKIPLK